jgi:hypothetical protein
VERVIAHVVIVRGEGDAIVPPMKFNGEMKNAAMLASLVARVYYARKKSR